MEIINTQIRRKETQLMAKCRYYISQRKFMQAEMLAKKNGFTTEAARLRAWDQGKSLPWPDKPAENPSTQLGATDVMTFTPPAAGVDIPAEAVCINGWPIECNAEVWSYPRNKKLVLIQLPDERTAAMWRQGIDYKVGARLRVRLESATADPYYVSLGAAD